MTERRQASVEALRISLHNFATYFECIPGRPPTERLAVVNAAHIHPKVNLVLQTVDGIQRISKRGVLPVLYLDQPGGKGPDVRALSDEPPPAGHRLKRSDVKIEAEPYLPSLRIHRYLSPYRVIPE